MVQLRQSFLFDNAAMSKRLGLLMVGHIDPKSQHIAGDYPDLFAVLLRDHNLDLIRYDLDRGAFPDRVDECDGWICSPSRSSVYDDEPWIADAESLHREFIAREIPYVGVCFGHQLLAQALGTAVERATDGWGVGVQSYEIATPQCWMGAAPPSRFSLLASHQDQVTALPNDAELLFTSSSGYCPIAGMTVGNRAWTIQPHPEFIAPLADHLLAGRMELIGADKVLHARESLTQPLDQPLVAQWIANFFRDV